MNVSIGLICLPFGYFGQHGSDILCTYATQFEHGAST